ncbi:MAG: FHA domain-containing protein [Rhodobacterales bacterium]|nr:FHA domain-containing protein [Rhodobacterales bacterium]
MPHLQFIRAGKTLFIHPLHSERTVIGRSDRCDVALPGDEISRIHCVIERKRDGWWITDRSRHGLRVNGEAEKVAKLSDGDRLVFGSFTSKFWLQGDDSLRRPTGQTPRWEGQPEEIVDVLDRGVAMVQAQLRFVRGARKDEILRVKLSRASLGGPGADIVLDEDLSARAAHVRVVRGRIMLAPGEVPMTLAGQRVRESTPTVLGEEVRVGTHGFVIEVVTVEETKELDSFGQMVGSSLKMRQLFGQLSRVSAHEHPVLLTGESGTGKELAAQGIHRQSLRCEEPFVAINCAAIASNLFESELFGHEKGAFTGADARQDGAFHRASGGCLFLDEVGELKLEMQAKLLRALESGEVRRVGAKRAEYPDVRVVAATNRDLRRMVREGTFREDLFFRLAVLTVWLPPLRDRSEDIGLLAKTLVTRNHPGATLTDAAVKEMLGYNWPGNVREMRNVITRAVVMSGPLINADSLVFNPWSFEPEPEPQQQKSYELDPDAIRAALARNGNNRSRTARELGIPRSSLLYRIRKYSLG